MKTIVKRFRVIFLLYLIIGIIMLSGCADVTNIDACRITEPYGFWSGLWHGLIMPISFIISLFKDNVAIYAVNNNGGWYDFGFIFFPSVFFGSSGYGR